MWGDWSRGAIFTLGAASGTIRADNSQQERAEKDTFSVPSFHLAPYFFDARATTYYERCDR